LNQVANLYNLPVGAAELNAIKKFCQQKFLFSEILSPDIGQNRHYVLSGSAGTAFENGNRIAKFKKKKLYNHDKR
jgi:hypothetical protein